MGDGPRAATSSGARAARGLAKAEAAAVVIQLVSNRRRQRVVIMQLTGSQEGSDDANETHCVWCVRSKREWIEFKGRAGAEQWGTVERSPFLNTFHDPRPTCAG